VKLHRVEVLCQVAPAEEKQDAPSNQLEGPKQKSIEVESLKAKQT
jgi:hypothetical protein